MKKLLTLGVIVLAILFPAALAAQTVQQIAFQPAETGLEGLVERISIEDNEIVLDGNFTAGGTTFGLATTDAIGNALVEQGSNSSEFIFHKRYETTNYYYAEATHIATSNPCYIKMPKSGNLWIELNTSALPGTAAGAFALNGFHLVTTGGEIYELDEMNSSFSFVKSFFVNAGETVFVDQSNDSTVVLTTQGVGGDLYFISYDPTPDTLTFDKVSTWWGKGISISSIKSLIMEEDYFTAVVACMSGNQAVKPWPGFSHGSTFSAIIRFDRDATKADSDRIDFMAFGLFPDMQYIRLTKAPVEWGGGYLMFYGGAADSMKISPVANHGYSYAWWDVTTLDFVQTGLNHVSNDWGTMTSIFKMGGFPESIQYHNDKVLLANNELTNRRLAYWNDGSLEVAASPVVVLDFNEPEPQVDVISIVGPDQIELDDIAIYTATTSPSEVEAVWSVESITGSATIDSITGQVVAMAPGEIIISATALGITEFKTVTINDDVSTSTQSPKEEIMKLYNPLGTHDIIIESSNPQIATIIFTNILGQRIQQEQVQISGVTVVDVVDPPSILIAVILNEKGERIASRQFMFPTN